MQSNLKRIMGKVGKMTPKVFYMIVLPTIQVVFWGGFYLATAEKNLQPYTIPYEPKQIPDVEIGNSLIDLITQMANKEASAELGCWNVICVSFKFPLKLVLAGYWGGTYALEALYPIGLSLLF